MLVDKLDKIYSSLRKQNKLQSLIRYVIRKVSNILIPMYFILTKRKVTFSKDSDLIISLTSFPDRISRLWLVIECICRQTVLPEKIILWLSNEQFPNKIHDIPSNLRKYVSNNNLQIEFVDGDLRSHKKYFYSFQMFPDKKIIVIDDDIFYPVIIIRTLLDTHRRYPEAIACLRAYIVKFDDDRMMSYNSWNKCIEGMGATRRLFHTIGGGILYKRN